MRTIVLVLDTPPRQRILHLPADFTCARVKHSEEVVRQGDVGEVHKAEFLQCCQRNATLLVIQTNQLQPARRRWTLAANHKLRADNPRLINYTVASTASCGADVDYSWAEELPRLLVPPSLSSRCASCM